jgi:hypothetical protein
MLESFIKWIINYKEGLVTCDTCLYSDGLGVHPQECSKYIIPLSIDEYHGCRNHSKWSLK